MAQLTLKLPEIPRGINPEHYHYYAQLHLNIKLLEEAINKIYNEVA